MKLVPLFRDRSEEAVRRKRLKRLIVAAACMGSVAALAGGGLFATYHYWPQARLEVASSALARVTLARFGEHVASVRVLDAQHQRIPTSLRNGQIEPLAAVAPATRLSVVVTVRRSRWIGWLVGRTEQVRLVVRTPATYLSNGIVFARANHEVEVHFSAPVKVVSVQEQGGKPAELTLPRPRRTVSLGIISAGADAAGTALVSGVPRRWESQPEAVRVNWFQSAPAPQVLVRPAPKSKIIPTAPIVLTFSRPVRQVLGKKLPVLKPKVKGTWTRPDSHTLVFTPSGIGFPLGRRIHLKLPAAIDVIAGADPAAVRTLTWQVPRASLLRIRQLLALEGYLPVTWRPSEHPIRQTLGAQVRAGIEPPEGSFSWAYPHTPAALRSLWSSNSERPTVVRGAIMAFEDVHNMTADGFPSMNVFRALVRDEIAGRHAPHPYTYIFVTETLPETLTLWHAGHVILTTPVNTGIPSRPTALGTYPVYSHLVETTMQGTNPDGTHYDDPGVPWVNYFNGGDAVHGFVRGGYGWPQSLGCVEAPVPTAGRIFPYVHIGTLVTVAS